MSSRQISQYLCGTTRIGLGNVSTTYRLVGHNQRYWGSEHVLSLTIELSRLLEQIANMPLTKQVI
jgi:hypothetical protein